MNIILAATLTLKMAAFTPSITTLDYFLGVALFTFFCANFNTEDKAWETAIQCKDLVSRVADIVELPECQKVIIPAYLYAVSALCVAFAVLELILITIANLFRACGSLCCRRERPNDR